VHPSSIANANAKAGERAPASGTASSGGTVNTREPDPLATGATRSVGHGPGPGGTSGSRVNGAFADKGEVVFTHTIDGRLGP
jgi:hypothetical protein